MGWLTYFDDDWVGAGDELKLLAKNAGEVLAVKDVDEEDEDEEGEEVGRESSLAEDGGGGGGGERRRRLH